ncbi:MAG TPA: CaiB/BaiF CoA-transferase family protein [Steroidobacteraceae bacterium]|nr:CaiB/BaiF CoA-transferase family protein [Steroidobacteraceae bacterium]
MSAALIVAPASGPLCGLKVLEFAGIGPVPFCGMLLADLGADVLRIDRPGRRYGAEEIETRGRRSLVLDLKSTAGLATALALAEKADALLEGYRPGVMERLGIGPDAVLARQPRLVYARMTGWGQSGPLAHAAGHDINFLALSGALHAIGPAERPAIPLNVVGDLGGGALYLAFGILAGVLHASKSGEGQVIDCAMADGAASLLAMVYGRLARGGWRDTRESNVIDGGAHFYNTYECADGKWLALGALEPRFYARLLRAAGIEDPRFAQQMDSASWPELRARLAQLLRTRSRDEWCRLFADADACVTPVLSLAEAPQHPHYLARQTFIELDGVLQPAPVPRFSRTPGVVQHGPVAAGTHDDTALASWCSEPPG